MTLEQQIIQFCIENIRELIILDILSVTFTIIGFKKEWNIIKWILAIISIPLTIMFIILLVQYLFPIIQQSFFS